MVIESQTIWQLGFLWISTNFVKFLIIVAVFIFCIKWVIGGTKNIFIFKAKWNEVELEQRLKTIEQDELLWTEEIDKRVYMLDKLRSTETAIRQEVDKLHQIQMDKNKNG